MSDFDRPRPHFPEIDLGFAAFTPLQRSFELNTMDCDLTRPLLVVLSFVAVFALLLPFQEGLFHFLQYTEFLSGDVICFKGVIYQVIQFEGFA